MESSSSYGGSKLIGEGLRFECQGCGSCCKGGDGYVFVTDDEVAAMAGHMGLKREDFFSGFTRQAQGRMALVDAPNGDCCFLKENRCGIYDVRPYQCRSWPFWFKNLRSDKAWKRVRRACPGIDRGRVHSPEEIIRWINWSPFLLGKK